MLGPWVVAMPYPFFHFFSDTFVVMGWYTFGPRAPISPMTPLTMNYFDKHVCKYCNMSFENFLQ